MPQSPQSPEWLIDTLGARRVLAFGAHPDDVDFGAAATLAALTERGVEVTLCLLTAGDAGGFEVGQDRAEMARRRQAEQEAAAAVLGIKEVILLDERDGWVESTPDLIRSIVRVMRQVQPDVVMSPHPERAWDRLQKSHPDHLACGEAVVRASYPAVENPFAFPELAEQEGLAAFKVRHLMLMAAPEERINLRVDVTDHVGQKLEALRKHFSQHPDPVRMEEFVLSRLRRIHAAGTAEGAPEGHAEDFHWVVVNGPETFAGF
ncbi:PIG-L deacetylase family protein [Nesterenkonia sp. HG001]|uniref:PIG-L deacetylase family protein n=1 Tax=Nesterenkonia sp. HG001 TaxID=2983207 RepID=UPI002AC55551|nr:PIG-L deacetylase family protein [Nesterenkonia sp. HG001]MDZ5076271.1 PIG-L family deacetylase [Nesterenkonia sp. HG001]